MLRFVQRRHALRLRRRGAKLERLDVTDADAVNDLIGRFYPTHVVHLAGVTTLAAAAADYQAAWQVHVFGSLNLANAILARVPECVLLFVGSGRFTERARDPVAPWTKRRFWRRKAIMH